MNDYISGGVGSERVCLPYSDKYVEVPRFETEITPRENFKRVAQRSNPLWIPISICDFQLIGAQDVVTKNVRGMQAHTDFRRPGDKEYQFTDWFNTSWTWVPVAGGAMLTPGTQLLDDITNWEKVVKFPDLSEWDFEETAERFMKTKYNPAKVLHHDIGRGCTERLISIMGGYAEGLMAMAMEPEATADFLNRFADFEIELFDKLMSLYPIELITYHDDWGTEKDTFFSEKMLEEIVFTPTKRIIDHIKSKGVAFELHSCGNITRFLPYTIELGADFLQLQRRAVDLPSIKEKYGGKSGFSSGLEGFSPDKDYSKDELYEIVHQTVELYGKSGGFYATVFAGNDRQRFDIINELHSYSCEYYKKNNII